MILADFKPAGSAVGTLGDNAVDEKSNSGATSNSNPYYPLFAQFGRNRFHFNPAPPKKGVTIHTGYNYKQQKSGDVPQVSGRKFVGDSAGTL